MPASWLACVWTLGPFREKMKPSFLQVFSLVVQLQVVPPRHCVSRGVQQGGLLQKVEATLDPHATDLLVPGHMGNAIGHQIPGPGFSWPSDIGIEDLSRQVSWCLGTWDSQSVARRLRADVRDTKFLRNCHNWHVFHRLAPCHFSHLFPTMETLPFPIRKSSPFLHATGPEIVLPVSSPTASL